MTHEKLSRFDPDVFIEVDDGFGGRSMAKVLEDGLRFVDLDDDDAPAWPLLEALQPAEVGNILGWGLYFVDQRPGDYQAWEALVTRMVRSGLDPLTYNRGLLWAFRAEKYDFAAARNAGLAATLKVRTLRVMAMVPQ